MEKRESVVCLGYENVYFMCLLTKKGLKCSVSQTQNDFLSIAFIHILELRGNNMFRSNSSLSLII